MAWINDKELKTPLTDFNRIVRSVYNMYYAKDGLIIPASMESIKEPMVFQNSFFTWQKERLDFMENHIIDPAILNSAMNDKAYEYEEKENISYLYGGKSGEKYAVSLLVNEKQAEDMHKYPGLQAAKDSIDTYSINWTLDEETKERLIDYETVSIPIGEDSYGNPIYVIATVKLFPAIKKADSITILAKPYLDKENLYTIFIVSTKKDQWNFYSKHLILNY